MLLLLCAAVADDDDDDAAAAAAAAAGGCGDNDAFQMSADDAQSASGAVAAAIINRNAEPADAGPSRRAGLRHRQRHHHPVQQGGVRVLQVRQTHLTRDCSRRLPPETLGS